MLLDKFMLDFNPLLIRSSERGGWNPDPDPGVFTYRYPDPDPNLDFQILKTPNLDKIKISIRDPKISKFSNGILIPIPIPILIPHNYQF